MLREFFEQDVLRYPTMTPFQTWEAMADLVGAGIIIDAENKAKGELGFRISKNGSSEIDKLCRQQGVER